MLSALDKRWNEILTLLCSDDLDERLTGEAMQKQFYLEYPEFSGLVNE